jgi:hypothetical protein
MKVLAAEMDYGDVIWMELVQDLVQWRIWVAALSKFLILQPQNITGKMNLKQIGCEFQRWVKMIQDSIQWRALELLPEY